MRLLRRFDRRHFRWWWQRRTRGFDDRELWNLDNTIAKFVAPRLRAFRQVSCCHPSDVTQQEWDDILELMCDAMDLCADDDKAYDPTQYTDKTGEGLRLFGEYFLSLWW